VTVTTLRSRVKAAVRTTVPGILLLVSLRPRTRAALRVLAGVSLCGFWVAVYRKYRAEGRAQTAREYDLLRTANWEAFDRHYEERVPTITEEFELWGSFHQHRHEMRYDLVADAVRAHVPAGGRILDVGCGSALVAERLQDVDATYVGLDYPEYQVRFAQKEFAGRDMVLRTAWVRGGGEQLPFPDASFDLVVMTEVIEHLLQPELAVWEISRVLRPGGVYVMTTNNASEVPLRNPLSHPLPWLEKMLGATRPELVSLRPWVWPEAVHESLLPPGSGPVYLPHTHHILGETRAMFAAAGLDTFRWFTFEFPPPQAATTAWLERRGERGRRIVDGIEAVARRIPGVRRLGCHLFVLARRTDAPVVAPPPVGVWPGPFSNGTTPPAHAGDR
jgi:ubiquinone/menaquinone biosynthesis C-methylase UbiE